MRRRDVLAAAVLLAAAAGGCGSGTAGGEQAAENPYNADDVMFLQMSLEYARQGAQVTGPVLKDATDAELRAVAGELDSQWGEESTVMRRWLLGWEQPVEPAPEASLHDHHGGLHSLRPEDIAELNAASGTQREVIARSLLLGHLHNTVALARQEATGGAYPPAVQQAQAITERRQGQIQRLLALP